MLIITQLVQDGSVLALTPFGRHLVREDVHNGKYVPEVHSRV
jgi:hypothetical protein